MTTTELTAALHRFSPIGLDDLSATADLQVRVDRKYLLPSHQVVELLDRLDPGAALALQIGDRRDFAYRSRYFDTPELSSYRSTALRRRHRFKVRTRRYAEAGESYLEVKTRGPRGATVKNRIGYPDGHDDRLTGTGHDFIGTVLDAQAVPLDNLDGLSPVLLTCYRRSTLLLPNPAGRPAARVTIDTDLAWVRLRRAGERRGDHLDGDPTTSAGTVGPQRIPVTTGSVRLPGLAVVETKTRGAASAIDRLLWAHGHRPTSISKYGTGMAALDQRLPSTRWHRTLGRLHPYRVPAVSTDQEALSCAAPF